MPATRIIVAAVVLGLMVASFVFAPVTSWSTDLMEWGRNAGFYGVVAFALMYIVATVLLVPGTVLTVGAGLVYGPLWGTLLVSPISVLAATIAFGLGRTGVRCWVQERLAGSTRFATMDAAIAKDGFVMVLLLRLSPLFPFSVLNYSLGITSIPLKKYVLASLIGMLPGTLLYVYLGSLLTTPHELTRGGTAAGGWPVQVLFWGGFVATLAAALLMTRSARKALAQALEREADAPAHQG